MPQIEAGSYLGDGTDGRPIITDLSGTLLRVDIGMEDGGTGGQVPIMKTRTMPGTEFLDFDGTPAGGTTPGVTISGADFIVDDTLTANQLNTIGMLYHWTAWSE